MGCPVPHRQIAALIAVLGLSSAAVAQDSPVTSQPLSVIEWLDKKPTSPQKPNPQLDEPPTAISGAVPQVTTTALTDGSPRQIGLVPPNVTGLPITLWSGSKPDRLISRLDGLPTPALPAVQSLLYTVLLAEALAPAGQASAGDALARARVRKLMSLGAIDPAQALIEQAGVNTASENFDLWMDISLLVGAEDRACATLAANRHLTRDYGTRIFCAARVGAWETAALTLGSAKALQLIPEGKLALLERFLHPEAFEDAPSLPAPRKMDALSFRLFESIGERLPTRNLPRTFAVADLRDIAGWKAQLEAAERLTRSGALPENRLLGLYTDRQPAASGGVWDRVAALQRFETALGTGSTDAVRKTLPAAWTAMAEADLEIAFAGLFARPLAVYDLDGKAGQIAAKVALLSPDYEAAAARMDGVSLALAVARGTATGNRPSEPVKAAVFDAFTDANPRPDLVAMVQQRRLGEAILEIVSLMDSGFNGNPGALRQGLATLRAIGLEDSARRSALQVLLLER